MILIADNKRVRLAFYPGTAGQNTPLWRTQSDGDPASKFRLRLEKSKNYTGWVG